MIQLPSLEQLRRIQPYGWRRVWRPQYRRRSSWCCREQYRPRQRQGPSPPPMMKWEWSARHFPSRAKTTNDRRRERRLASGHSDLFATLDTNGVQPWSHFRRPKTHTRRDHPSVPYLVSFGTESEQLESRPPESRNLVPKTAATTLECFGVAFTAPVPKACPEMSGRFLRLPIQLAGYFHHLVEVLAAVNRSFGRITPFKERFPIDLKERDLGTS